MKDQAAGQARPTDARTKKQHELEWLFWASPKSLFTCRQCRQKFGVMGKTAGRKPRYCSDACKQKAYRERRDDQS